MAEKSKQSGYDHPAGGWGALKTSLGHVLENKTLIKGSLTLLKVNQPTGFDCPGCAWPEPKDGETASLEFCENGIKAVTFETTGKRVGPDFFSQHTVTELREKSDRWLENEGRLTHPMRYNRETDHYEPVSWEEAFDLIGETLKSLESPDEAILYTSGRTSNEAAFLYQLFARILGTNNLPDCSNMCHESSGVAMMQQIGVGKGTVRIDDFDKADAIFMFGQNPGTNHPRMLSTLQKASKRGAKIVTFNPLREPGSVAFTHPQQAIAMLTGGSTPISSHFYPIMIGGDLAALKGMIKHLLEADRADPGAVVDRNFIKQHTDNFEAFAEDIAAESWETITQQSGLTREQLIEAAEVYRHAGRVIACWAMGLTQHKHAVGTIQMIVNLLLLRGQIGKEGAGPCPVRGHSNVQGDRTMGITEQPSREFLEGLRRTFAFEPPTEHGHDVVGAINAMHEGQAKVFIGMGGNFARAAPDTPLVKDAMQRCELTVNIATKLNHTHLATGRDSLILPCLGRTEIDLQATGPQRVTVEDSMSQVHASAGANDPASQYLRSEPAIVAGMAKATFGATSPVDWDWLIADYSRIRNKIAETMPRLFQRFNRRLDSPGGFYLGNTARDRQWNTRSGKARFMAHTIPDLTLPPGQLRMMTLRSHDQFNTTVYSNNDRYRGIKGTRMVVMMNEDDIAERGLSVGQKVTLVSHTREDGKQRQASGFEVRAYDLPRGCCATYFPEANVLVSKDSFAKGSRTPLSKFVPVTVEPEA